MRLSSALVVMSGLLVVMSACQRGTDATPGPSAAPSPTRVEVLPRIRGTWLVALTPKQEKDVRTMRLVFDGPEPTPEQLADLAPEERATILAVRESRKKTPNDPRFLEMRAVLDGMGRSTLVIYTSSLTIAVGQVRQTAQFDVKTETSTSVLLSASTPAGKREDVLLALPAPDELRMSKPHQPDALTFRRAPQQESSR